jgi:uncharacterized protein YcfJ
MHAAKTPRRAFDPLELRRNHQEATMDAQAMKQTHPILIIAGIAVTLFSFAGVAAIFGWIPTSTGQNAPSAASVPAPVAQAPEQPKPAAQPETPAPAARHAKPHAPRVAKAAPQPVQVAKAEPQIAQLPPSPPPPAPRPICRECGVIDGVHEIEKAGKASGGGAIGGAIVGGVLGHQTGGGRGHDVMTVLGAVGGGLAGNAIEKNVTKTKEYEILVRFEDGSTRIIKMPTAPAWRVGDKVKVIDGVIQSNG